MLTHLNIKNFVLVEQLALELESGFTILTGETGVGKSILLDALEFALGERANAQLIRPGQEQCEVSLEFTIDNNNTAKNWLSDLDFDNNQCLLRRVIKKDGRSRAYINGQPVTIQQLRELACLLINIHGQHENQQLLQKSVQQNMLDAYAKCQPLADKVAAIYKQWHEVQQQLNSIQNNNQQRSQRSEFLRYQLNELEQLGLQENELALLEQEHNQLSNSEHISQSLAQLLDTLTDDEQQAVNSQLQHSVQQLNELVQFIPQLSNTSELLNTALVQIEEAIDELRQHTDIEYDPQRLQTLEQRLQIAYQLARKHQIKPEQLPTFQQQISAELQTLDCSDEHIEQLQQQLTTLSDDYKKSATQLSGKRQKAATAFQQQVSKHLHELGMPGAEFYIELTATTNQQFSNTGLEKTEFKVRANPGQPITALAQTASGGELSRISLAIEVITAQLYATPSLIFDEIDTGIGGNTAVIIGKLLRELSANTQVLCITHLPQIAACANHHLQVSKQQQNDSTQTQIQWLDNKEKINEIARMLGGVKLTKQTLAHAEALLQNQA